MTSLDTNVRMLQAAMELYAPAKRFNERWLADPAFRAALFSNPERAIADYAIPVDPDEVRGITAGDAERAGSLAQGIVAISALKSAVMDRWYGPESTASDPVIAAWRARQHERMRLELGAFQTKASVRAAWSAELSRGCNGGCWFCNMAAPALDGVAPADSDGLDEWRRIVRALASRLGPAIRTGFLDGASDPFDHPDYEAFCRVVLDEAGFFPPTSTALALRDPARTRRFFAEAMAAGCWSVRLTVRDQEEFDAIHATFSAADLAHVQLNTFTPDSSFVFSLTGRFRERYLRDPEFAVRERRKLAFAPWYTVNADYRRDRSYPLDANTGTVGFSLRMVERTVGLVAPRPSSDTHPLGFATLDRLPFGSSDEFDAAVATLIRRWMPTHLHPTSPLALWPGLRIEQIPDGVRLHGRFAQFTDIVDPPHESAIRTIADAMQGGTTVAQIARSGQMDEAQVLTWANRFFAAGLLEDARTND